MIGQVNKKTEITTLCISIIIYMQCMQIRREGGGAISSNIHFGKYNFQLYTEILNNLQKLAKISNLPAPKATHPYSIIPCYRPV